jgi:hypothetical protein
MPVFSLLKQPPVVNSDDMTTNPETDGHGVVWTPNAVVRPGLRVVTRGTFHRLVGLWPASTEVLRHRVRAALMAVHSYFKTVPARACGVRSPSQPTHLRRSPALRPAMP